MENVGLLLGKKRRKHMILTVKTMRLRLSQKIGVTGFECHPDAETPKRKEFPALHPPLFSSVFSNKSGWTMLNTHSTAILTPFQCPSKCPNICRCPRQGISLPYHIYRLHHTWKRRYPQGLRKRSRL